MMNEKKFKIPSCPCCGRKLKFSESFSVHKLGEYFCINCGYYSKITYQKKLKVFAIIAIAISILFASIAIGVGEVSFFEIILCIVPFLLFYFCIPYTMILSQKNQEIIKKEKEKDKNKTNEKDSMKVYSVNDEDERKYVKIKENSIDYGNSDRTRIFTDKRSF